MSDQPETYDPEPPFLDAGQLAWCPPHPWSSEEIDAWLERRRAKAHALALLRLRDLLASDPAALHECIVRFMPQG